MKKLLVSLFAVVLLAGCGNSGSTNETSKTCTVTESGMNIDATFKATDDKIKSSAIKVAIPSSLLGGVDLSALSADQKKLVEEQMLTTLGVDDGEGIEVKTDFSKESMTVEISVDLEKSSADVLETLGFADVKDTSLTDMVKSAETGGATCK